MGHAKDKLEDLMEIEE